MPAPARPVPEWLVRVAAALGLAVSVLLFIDYARPLDGLCSTGGGCDVVKHSSYAHLLGIPTPALGIGYFAAVLLAASVRRARPLLLPLALTGAAGALAFIAVQAFVLHAFCRYCLVADVSAVLIAAGALALRGRSPIATRRATRLTPALALAALVGPMLWAQGHAPAPPPAPLLVAGAALPEPIAREQRAGVLTIVEFIDFECPFCRRLHAELEKVLPSYGEQVRVVRKMLPLTRLHRHALDAALAWCCADQAGHGDAMADALARADDLTPAGCERLAAGLGLDGGELRRCMADPRTRGRIDADVADSVTAGVDGRLPTYWIGSTMYRGAADARQLRARIDAALAR